MEGESNVNFLNVSYFFRLIYDLLTGGGSIEGPSGVWPAIVAFISAVWVLITILAFLVSVAAIGVLLHATMRMQRAKAADAPNWATIGAHEAEVKRDHNRWEHVIALIESPNDSDWRQAIIEADIMLDDLLSQLGYHGQSVGEKLRAVDPSRFRTLNDAWEAHKIRNEIAHQGSAFNLTDQLAYRTILRYENVMLEFGEIEPKH